ncbi:beta-xylosidase/alpha-l-arabinosidase [Phaeacidiphilus oryzae]|uniref:beta-xylosidase/alpha-l-arabinosidase n=1 Tax=Phaeacidiphilus oryzae TaxID=348818 RepID=UPI00055EC281|nr:glycoside hydrolase family 3 N-terminal domain-containing protein [Phaeacidiphilus oryzae]
MTDATDSALPQDPPGQDPPGQDAPRQDAPWRDPALTADARADALLAEMTLREKAAQLQSLWVGASDGDDGDADVAPHQHENLDGTPPLEALLPYGLGQLTRPFGTAPVDPAVGAGSLARAQRRIMAGNRFGIPAIAHEECLAGFTAWGATIYPVPLSWGATFDPALVAEMAAAIGRDLRRVGVHQGLAPVLDVVRDVRWGRVEETIGEDPYLVGSVGTAYVRGLRSAGVVATLKHFAGYSASRAGRNLAPVSMGLRERADVILPPFEMAIREGEPGSVMQAYTDTDGVPSAADRRLLTELLREVWGFDGTVVSDYFGVAFLHSQHGIAADLAGAAAAALSAGVDVELPSLQAYAEPLLTAVQDGRLSEETVDIAVRRVLRQKIELGLLDPDYAPEPPGISPRVPAQRHAIDLDPPENRALARRIAEEAVVLLANDGTLPLTGPGRTAPGRVALVGPTADEPSALLGCYSFPMHVGPQHPGTPPGVELPTLRSALTAELPDSAVAFAPGLPAADATAVDGFAAAVDAVRGAEVAVLALGDRAGLFGRGTSGEGCDAEDLELPGAQRQLLEAVLDAAAEAGTRVVVVVLSGRPYALGRAVGEAAAIVQAFFPGEEGANAVAGVLGGRVAPSGRLPVGVPGRPGGQPGGYLSSRLALAGDSSNQDPTPAFPFGHGLTYTRFGWEELSAETPSAPTDGELRFSFTLRNTGERAGTEVVQVYLHDPVASVVRPVQRLVGYRRVALEPRESCRIEVAVPADLAAFTGLDGRRIVEPGELELRFGDSSAGARLVGKAELTGPVRTVDHTRRLHAEFREFREGRSG